MKEFKIVFYVLLILIITGTFTWLLFNKPHNIESAIIADSSKKKIIYEYKAIGWVTQSPNVQGVAYFQYGLNQSWQYSYFYNWHLVSGSTNTYTCSEEVYLTSGYFISLNCIGLHTNANSTVCIVNLDTGSVLWLQSPCNAGPTFKINYILP